MSRSRSRPAAPPLPLPIVELVLVLAPHVINWQSRAIQLLGVLPRQVAPKAFQTLMLACNYDCVDYPPPTLTINHFISSSSSSYPFPLDGDDDACPRRQQIPKDLQLMLSVQVLARECFSGMGSKLVIAAAKAGRLDLLEYLDNSFELVAEFQEKTKVTEAACAGGSLAVLRWLVARGYAEECTLEAAAAAVECGFAWVVEWLADHFPLHAIGASGIMIDTACAHGKAEFLGFIFHRFGIVEWNSRHWDLASENGHVRLLQYLKDQLRVPLPSSDPFNALDLASANGHVNVLDWWFNNSRHLAYTVNAMDEASANGHLHVLEWWARSGLEMRFTPAAKTQAMANGHWDVVKFWSQCGAYRFLASGSASEDPHGYPQVPKDIGTLAAFGQLNWLQDGWTAPHGADWRHRDRVCPRRYVFLTLQMGMGI